VFITSVEDRDGTSCDGRLPRRTLHLGASSARGEWKAEGSNKAGYDAYATSKQANLATVLAFARQTPRLRFRGIESGLNPGTGPGRDAGPTLQVVAKRIARAGAVITRIQTNDSDATSTFYNENGKPMRASKEVNDSAFSDRVVTETREFLAQNRQWSQMTLSAAEEDAP
jgi:hypothetical protein